MRYSILFHKSKRSRPSLQQRFHATLLVGRLSLRSWGVGLVGASFTDPGRTRTASGETHGTMSRGQSTTLAERLLCVAAASARWSVERGAGAGCSSAVETVLRSSQGLRRKEELQLTPRSLRFRPRSNGTISQVRGTAWANGMYGCVPLTQGSLSRWQGELFVTSAG